MTTPDFIFEDKSCEVDKKLKVHAKSDDHLPLVAVAYVPSTMRQPITKRRQPLYSRNAVRIEAKRGHLSKSERGKRVHARISELYDVQANFEATSHAYVINTQIENIVAQEFPPDETTAQAPWMSSETFELTQLRSDAWSYLNRIGRKIVNATAWLVFRMMAYNAAVRPKPG